MTKRRIMIELSHSSDLAGAAFNATAAAERGLESGTVPKIAGCTYDFSFSPVALPSLKPRTALDQPYVSGQKFDLSVEPEESTYVVRAEVDEARVDEVATAKNVVGVFSDVEIEPMLICPGSPPMGTHADVEKLLCVPQLKGIKMDGTGVLVAIVDTGINLAHLAAHGKTITLDAARSWVPAAGMIPGNAPVGHGTMCAFDSAIAAPKATFLDIQLLRSTASGPTVMSGFLSDAQKAYSHLCNVMQAPRRPGEARSLVVNNSWGMFHPTWDFPVGHPGNYSDNPGHPFNRIVSTLEQLGADILFAAGNCGANCPDGRCQNVTANAIYGANGHPSVLTIAGVDISNTRVGYSSQGPGRLSKNKPDLCGYTHFQGSGVYAADGGTSAATPVVTGVVAALRTKIPYQPGNPSVSPSAVRALLRSTATDLGAAGFDFDHGFGVIGGCALYRKYRGLGPIDICERFPWICRHRPLPIDLCKRFPELCSGIPRPPFPPIPPGPRPPASAAISGDTPGSDGADDMEALLAAFWEAGYFDGQLETAAAPGVVQSKDCGCGGKAHSV
jgi:hypothetical protein